MDLHVVSRLPSLTYEHNQENNSLCVSYHSLLWCISSMALHTKIANPLGKPKKPKKPKAPSQKHSKTIEKTKKKQKNLRSQQLGSITPWAWASVGLQASIVAEILGFFVFFFLFSRWFCYAFTHTS